MIVDSSALFAVLNRESDAERYQEAMLTAPNCRMSVANILEAFMVAEGRSGPAAGRELEAFLARAGIEPEPVTVEQMEAARQAWRRFGRGNHPAGLNFGDCFAYALASVTGEPLLFKGGDFPQTDIPAA